MLQDSRCLTSKRSSFSDSFKFRRFKFITARPCTVHTPTRNGGKALRLSAEGRHGGVCNKKKSHERSVEMLHRRLANALGNSQGQVKPLTSPSWRATLVCTWFFMVWERPRCNLLLLLCLSLSFSFSFRSFFSSVHRRSSCIAWILFSFPFLSFPFLSFPPSSRSTTSFSVRYFYLLSRNYSTSWVCLPVRICPHEDFVEDDFGNKIGGARKNGNSLEAIDNVWIRMNQSFSSNHSYIPM